MFFRSLLRLIKMSITTNDLLSTSNNKLSGIEQKYFQEKEINNIISLFIIKRNFIFFKKTTINL